MLALTDAATRARGEVASLEHGAVRSIPSLWADPVMGIRVISRTNQEPVRAPPRDTKPFIRRPNDPHEPVGANGVGSVLGAIASCLIAAVRSRARSGVRARSCEIAQRPRIVRGPAGAAAVRGRGLTPPPRRFVDARCQMARRSPISRHACRPVLSQPCFSPCSRHAFSAGLACGGGQQDPRAIMAVIFWLDPQNRDGAP